MEQFKLQDKDYAGSGIKTLRAVGNTFLALGIIGGIVGLLTSLFIQNGYFFLGAIAAIIQGFAVQGFCNAIAKIAECQIYKRALVEQQMTNKEQEKKVEKGEKEACQTTETT